MNPPYSDRINMGRANYPSQSEDYTSLAIPSDAMAGILEQVLKSEAHIIFYSEAIRSNEIVRSLSIQRITNHSLLDRGLLEPKRETENAIMVALADQLERIDKTFDVIIGECEALLKEVQKNKKESHA